VARPNVFPGGTLWHNHPEESAAREARRIPEETSLASGQPSDPVPPPAKEDNPLQHLLSESTADALNLRLQEPLRLAKTDLADLVSQGVSALVTMAAELGVVLRIRMKGEKTTIAVDPDKIRRVSNALVIHLLSVSQSEGRVTVELEDKPVNGKRGVTLRFTAGNVVLPWKTNPEFEAEWNAQPELAACRKIVEKHKGTMRVEWSPGNKLICTVWLPARFPTGAL
jgi:light-regulated signal transduction histidine kinase (bacteriophytochrome)